MINYLAPTALPCLDKPRIKRDTGHTTSISGQPHPTAFAVFLRPKFNYGRDDRPKYNTFGEYASRLIAVVESRLPTTNGKVLQLNQLGVTRMKNPTQKPPCKSALFNLVKGNQVVCQDLTFSQVTTLLKEIPACCVKFSRMAVQS